MSYVSSIPNPRLAKLAFNYMRMLVDGNRIGASAEIFEAIDDGVSIKDIYLSVFQPVQFEIGRLWQLNELSIVVEHYCTAATQLIMSQLFPRIISGKRNGFIFVSCCVGRELHEIGMRMVTDFFEMDGWGTHFLGANIQDTQLIAAVRDKKADLIGISATMPDHVRLAQDLITSIRTNVDLQRVKIIVGGGPFATDSDRWRSVGADGFGSNAQQAIEIGRKLVMEDGDEQ